MARKPLKIFLSVDVEPRLSKSIATFGKVPPIGLASLNGVRFINETLEHYNAKALYFIETLHYYYYQDTLLKYLKPFSEQPFIEVGLHTHPAWLFFKDKIVRSDNCSDFSEQDLYHIIRDSLDILNRYIDKPVTYFRSGNLSSSDNLYMALNRIGFKSVSTSSLVYGNHIHSHYHAPFVYSDVKDIPVTSFNRQGYKPQLWSITGVSHSEASMLLMQAYRKDCEFIMILTHPFEFKTLLGRNLKGNQSRLIKLCQFVQNNPDKFEFSVDLGSVSQKSDIILESNPVQYAVSLLQSKFFEQY